MKTLKDFFESVGPNQPVVMAAELVTLRVQNSTHYYALEVPRRLDLHCSNCGGDRGFVGDANSVEINTRWRTDRFLTFKCKDCESRFRTYAVNFIADDGTKIKVAKFGELPPFGPNYDATVGALLGDDEHLYRKALDCESGGLGIGAFAYYRRVLENQRTAIFEKVIAVAEKLQASDDLLRGLKTAKDDRQFTKAIDAIKAGPLQSIYINGHNPLTLLYDAVSDGLHGQSDEDNLEVAQTIRLLLADLAKRLEQAMADHKEVESAVNRLLQTQAKRRLPAK